MTSLVASSAAGTVGQAVTFTAEATATNCTLGSFTWSFGDGSPEEVVRTSRSPSSAPHAFAAPGTYEVRVTARSSTGENEDSRTLAFAVAGLSPTAVPSPGPSATPAPTGLPSPTSAPSPTGTPSGAPSSGNSGGGCDGGVGSASLLLGILPLLLAGSRRRP